MACVVTLETDFILFLRENSPATFFLFRALSLSLSPKLKQHF